MTTERTLAMDTTHYQNESALVGDSDEDTVLLRSMASDARKYLAGFSWCPAIRVVYLADGIGGVVAVFLVELAEKLGGQDGFLWVILGDLPSAYLVTDEISNPREAIESYCEIMDEWIAAVRSGKGLHDAFPVGVQPSLENAQLLAKRLDFLRETVAPSFS